MFSANAIVGLVSFASLLISSLVVARLSRASGVVDYLLSIFVVFAGQVILLGHALSQLALLSRLEAWTAASLVSLSFVLILRWRVPSKGGRAVPEVWAPWSLKGKLSGLSLFEKTVLVPCLGAAALSAELSFWAMVRTAPHEPDSLSYHLVRMAYYLQQGSLSFFEANYWAQVVHPVNASILSIYTFLATGRSENLVPLVQFISYLASALAVYGISRRTGCARTVSLAAAGVFALLIEVLMGSVTAQNDLLITAFVGSSVFFLLTYADTGGRRNLVLAGLAAGLAVGVKASALLTLPSLMLVAAAALGAAHRRLGRSLRRELVVALAGAGLGFFLFALPSGYLANTRRFGNPFGPPNVVRSHSFAGQSPRYVLTEGTKNLLRYAIDFLSLDGLPPAALGNRLQEKGRRTIATALEFWRIRLEDPAGVRAAFSLHKRPVAHELHSSWGILGWALVWPSVGWVLLARGSSGWGKTLALASALFFAAQVFSGPYDPWRVRYFTTAAVFACPVTACLLTRLKGRFVKVLVVAVVGLGGLSGVSAVFERRAWALPFGEEAESRDRLRQLTHDLPKLYPALREYEQLVPSGATVAAAMRPDSAEYLLFGERLTRQIIPINSFLRGPQPLPPEAQFLIYTRGYPGARTTDIHLGADWYLRELVREGPRISNFKMQMPRRKRKKKRSELL